MCDADGDDVFGDDVQARVNADVVEEVGVHEKVLGDVGVVELVVLDVEVEHDMLILEGEVLSNVDVVELDVLGEGVHELVPADVVEDVDVLKEELDKVGVLVGVEDVNVNLVLAALGVERCAHVDVWR
eukprot:1883172-Amphidinium_carterae.1